MVLNCDVGLFGLVLNWWLLCRFDGDCVEYWYLLIGCLLVVLVLCDLITCM